MEISQYFSGYVMLFFCYVLLCTSHTISYKRSEHAPNRAPCTHAKRQNLFACNILATKNTFSVIINNLLVQMTWESLGGGRSAGEREIVTSRNPGHNDSHFLPRIHRLPTGDSFASRLFLFCAGTELFIFRATRFCVSLAGTLAMMMMGRGGWRRRLALLINHNSAVCFSFKLRKPREAED